MYRYLFFFISICHILSGIKILICLAFLGQKLQSSLADIQIVFCECQKQSDFVLCNHLQVIIISIAIYLFIIFTSGKIFNCDSYFKICSKIFIKSGHFCIFWHFVMVWMVNVQHKLKTFTLKSLLVTLCLLSQRHFMEGQEAFPSVNFTSVKSRFLL